MLQSGDKSRASWSKEKRKEKMSTTRARSYSRKIRRVMDSRSFCTPRLCVSYCVCAFSSPSNRARQREAEKRNFERATFYASRFSSLVAPATFDCRDFGVKKLSAFFSRNFNYRGSVWRASARRTYDGWYWSLRPSPTITRRVQR